MILVLVAFVLLVGVTSGLLWWRLGPGWAGDVARPGAGFDGLSLPSSVRTPPRPDEGVQWIDSEEERDGWSRALTGLLLVLAVAVAAAALATGIYMAGKFLFHEVIKYVGRGSRL
jgi:hypothetical protein